MTDQPPQPPISPPPTPGGFPFEEPGRPFLEGLWETFKLLVTNPTEGFARMPVTTDIGRPLLYAIVLGWVGAIVSFVWGRLFQGGIMGLVPHREMDDAMASFFVSTMFGMVVVVLAPMFIVIGAFVISGLVHLFLMMVGGANRGFVATLRAVCYADTAQVANIIPFFGGIVALVWSLVLSVIGLTAAHQTTTGKAVAAVLLPVVFCCGCLFLLVFLGIAGAISSSSM